MENKLFTFLKINPKFEIGNIYSERLVKRWVGTYSFDLARKTGLERKGRSEVLAGRYGARWEGGAV